MDTTGRDHCIPKRDSVSVFGDRESFREQRSLIRIGSCFFDYTHGSEMPQDTACSVSMNAQDLDERRTDQVGVRTRLGGKLFVCLWDSLICR